MVFIQAWDETTPPGGEAIANGDNRIRAMKEALRERLAIDHYFLAAEAGDDKIGYHNKATFVNQSPDPAAVANALILFAKVAGGKSELFSLSEDAAFTQLTLLGKLLISALSIAGEQRGDLIVRDASGWTRKALGVARKLLISDGTDANWDSLLASDLTPIILTPKEYTLGEITSANDEVTSNTSPQDTTLTLTFTVGKDGLVFGYFSARADSSTGIAHIDLLVDGAIKSQNCIPNGVLGNPVTLFYAGVLAAGSHTVKIQIKGTSGGAVTLKGTDFISRLNVAYPT